jgi:DNA polymerase I-like protein with 3'-5' exonuclease and polymerase domains
MIGKIKFIADVQTSCYERTTFPSLMKWLRLQNSFEFDIETDVTPWWHNKQLISMQFGSTTEDRVQWFIQWSALTPEEQEEMRVFLNRSKAFKLIHNARFEYIVLRFYGIVLGNIYDTMLAEKVLRGGMENMEYSLADISWKYLRIIMNKELQMTFGDNIITDEKILYGITDVAYLSVIRRIQLLEACQCDGNGYNLLNTLTLEMECLPAFADITYEGMLLDKVKWRENIAQAEPLVQTAYDKLNAWLNTEPFYTYAVRKGYICSEDRITINYNSPPQKAELLRLLFPGIIGSGKPVVKKYIRDHGMELTPENIMLLQDYCDSNYDALQDRLVKEHRQYLIEHDYLIPAGQCTINWGSQQQVLPLVQLVLPKLKSLAEEERNKFVHPILKDWEKYGESNKLLTTYGEQFIQQYVSDDGKVRTNFNQVLTTGRVSSSKPNMQNIPVKEAVGTRYRNAFVCDPDFVFVDSDYTSGAGSNCLYE